MIQGRTSILPVMRPRLPTLEQLRPYLERIDSAGIYSNFGPLHAEFTERLADYFAVGVDQVALVGNGTLALQAAVETVGEIGDTWVLPSWTFVATAQAILSARRRLHFVDVDLDSWAVAPLHRTFAKGHMVVAPFGSKPDLVGWRKVPGPKVFDAASCFDACAGIGDELDDSSMVMLSLHATKSLPAGEGGVLIGPPEWVRQASVWANFGFDGERVASGPGLNAKLSEYHAAVGLASLDAWPVWRDEWLATLSQAQSLSESWGLSVQPSLKQGLATSTWNVVLPLGASRPHVVAGFAEHGVETRIWWPEGVHAMPSFIGQTTDALPVTESLVERVLGLPFGRGLLQETFDYLGAVGAQVFQTVGTASSPDTSVTGDCALGVTT